MRLDKYLKISRLIKRRTMAKEIADKGRITINGHQAKAASNVAVDDELVIQFGQKEVAIRINRLKEAMRKEESDMMYTIIHEK